MDQIEFMFTSKDDEYQEHTGIATLRGSNVLVIHVAGHEFKTPTPYTLIVNLETPSESFYVDEDGEHQAMIRELHILEPDEDGIRDIQFEWDEQGILWFVEGQHPLTVATCQK